jgi:ABC-type sugar transport system ATPase subunit
MGAKLELYDQIKDWAADGMSFLWLSSDLVETLMLCHRAYAMYDGRIVDEFVNPTLDDEEAILAGVLGRESTTAAASPTE